MSKATKREANAISRLSKPSSTLKIHDPNDFQWQIMLADQKKRQEVEVMHKENKLATKLQVASSSNAA